MSEETAAVCGKIMFQKCPHCESVNKVAGLFQSGTLDGKSDNKATCGFCGQKFEVSHIPLKEYDKDSGKWGFLPNEPCRFCHSKGCIYFMIDEGPEGKTGLSPVRCDNCKRTWTPESSTA